MISIMRKFAGTECCAALVFQSYLYRNRAMKRAREYKELGAYEVAGNAARHARGWNRTMLRELRELRAAREAVDMPHEDQP